MIKPKLIGQTVKYNNGKSVTAGGSYQNGAIGNVSNNVFTVSSTALEYILVQEQVGDDEYDSAYVVASGADCRVYALDTWDGFELQATPESYEFATSSDYDDFAVGTTHFTVNSTNGKLLQVTATATNTDYFKLTKKIMFNGKGIEVTKVHTANS